MQFYPNYLITMTAHIARYKSLVRDTCLVRRLVGQYAHESLIKPLCLWM
jgi:hypothetical protein